MSNTFTNPNVRPIATTDIVRITGADGITRKYKWDDVKSFIAANMDSVTGSLTVTGKITANGGIDIATTTDLVLGADSNITVNTDKFTVTGASGNTAVAGTLDVTGDVAVNTDKVTITAASGDTTIAGTLGITGKTSTSAVNRKTDVKATGYYNPSVLTQDHILIFDGLSQNTVCNISLEDINSGSPTSGREIIVKNADDTYNVTVSMEGNGYIDNDHDFVLTPYESVTIIFDGTNGHII